MENPLSTHPSGFSRCAAESRSVDPTSKAVNSFTYSQRKKLKSQEKAQPEKPNLKPDLLDPSFAEKMRADSRSGVSLEQKGGRSSSLDGGVARAGGNDGDDDSDDWRAAMRRSNQARSAAQVQKSRQQRAAWLAQATRNSVPEAWGEGRPSLCRT